MDRNLIKEIREALVMSRAELARKAEVSVSTIYRVEKGKSCQGATKMKLLQALGYDFSDKDKVFLEDC